MSSRVFISYNFDKDRERVHSMRGRFQASGGNCQGEPVFVPLVQSKETDEIDRTIRATMQGCVGAVFVIGDDVHNSPWIEREAELATSKHLWLVAVRVAGTTGGLPPALQKRNIQIVQWADLCSAVNGKMTSG